MKKTVVVNLYGGPGSGKSSLCASIFAELKWRDIETEMCLEYAKDRVWEGSAHVLENQLYVFGKQQHRMYRLNGKVDIIVTDSPLLLSIIYDSKNDTAFRQVVLNEFNSYNNINLFVRRKKKYNPNGRLQTFEQAKEKDVEVKSLLNDNGISYVEIDGEPSRIEEIVDFILKERNILNNA
jgi:hypothetical protein